MCGHAEFRACKKSDSSEMIQFLVKFTVSTNNKMVIRRFIEKICTWDSGGALVEK